MFNSLFKWIYRREWEENRSMLENKYKQKEMRLNAKALENERQYGLLKHIFLMNPNAMILGIGKNKKDEELMAVLVGNVIYLYGERYQGMCGLPRILFEINEANILEGKVKNIRISDVLIEDIDIGNGTVAMEALIKYAKIINVKYIAGEFSRVDDDHADRRKHYYEKFGFAIKDRTIRLDL